MSFPVHEIRVTKVAYDDPPTDLGIEPTTLKYRISHGTCERRGDECLVEDTITELGLHAALFGVFDTSNRLTVAHYWVRGWVSKHDVPGEAIEYDAGIEEVPHVRV
jgi:hypothetical protein